MLRRPHGGSSPRAAAASTSARSGRSSSVVAEHSAAHAHAAGRGVREPERRLADLGVVVGMAAHGPGEQDGRAAGLGQAAERVAQRPAGRCDSVSAEKPYGPGCSRTSQARARGARAGQAARRARRRAPSSATPGRRAHAGRLGVGRRRRGRGPPAAIGPPTAATGLDVGSPEPSRRGSIGGSGAGAPWGVAARAGAGPTQATSEGVLALEEALSADAAGGATLAGVLRERRHLDGGAGGARQSAAGAGGGDHDATRGRRRRRRRTPPAGRRPRRTPAMPPAGRPCGRTDGRREVQQLRVGRDEHELLVAGRELDRADDAVAVVEPDHGPRVGRRRDVGRHPLDHAVGRAEREAGPLVRTASTGRPAARPCRARRAPRAGRRRRARARRGSSGSVGSSSTGSRSTRPALVTRPTWPRALRADGRDDDVVRRRARRRRAGRGRRPCARAGRCST